MQVLVSKVDNGCFDPRCNFDLGRPKWIFYLWYIAKITFVQSSFPWPSQFKVALLRLFGATIGKNVYLKPRVNVHFPWKLSVGDNVWIGEEVFICNFAQVDIGRNCCISQRAFICSGNHNYKASNMEYMNRAICIQDGCWVGAMSFVGPGVVMECDSVLGAGSFAFGHIRAATVYSGNPCVPKRPRWVTFQS